MAAKALAAKSAKPEANGSCHALGNAEITEHFTLYQLRHSIFDFDGFRRL